jgi:uncharacterized tellurite resistance protein B-like protein
MDEIEELTEAEMLALAALLRALIRADGAFSPAEHAALSAVAASVTLIAQSDANDDATYRSTGEPLQPLGDDALFALIERAGRELPDEDSIRALARTVTRPAARATIHALLFEVAASDGIAAGESAVLDWLAECWALG